MPLKHWKKLYSEVKARNRWWTYIVDRYAIPGLKEGEYHYAHTEGSVFIIPVTGSGRILLVNQYRYLNDRESLEFPGGGVKEGQEPDDAARMELIEETGFDGDLEKVGVFNPYNGVTDEICHVYTAKNLKHSVEFLKDDGEEFEMLELDAAEVQQKVESNEIYDGMTLASWALARKLFI